MEDNHNLMHFRGLLTRIDCELCEEDVENLIFLCDSHLSSVKQQSIKSAHQLFDVLERKQIITPWDLTLLNVLFKITGRMDLFEILPESSVAGNTSCQSSFFQYQKYIDPFIYLLFCIHEELTQEEVQRLRYLCEGVPKNAKISSALDLFKILKKQKTISPENLDRLNFLFATIERSDLVDLVQNFLRDNAGISVRQTSPLSETPMDIQSPASQAVSYPEPSGFHGVQLGESASVFNVDSTNIRLERQYESHVSSDPQSTASRFAFPKPLPEPQMPSSDPQSTASRIVYPKPLPPMNRTVSAPSGAIYRPDSFFWPQHSPIEENVNASERSAQVTMECDETDNSTDTDAIYKMTAEPRGICLVIDNDKFFMPDGYEGVLLNERRGSNKDAADLRNCFKTLKFDVHTETNLTNSKMRSCLKRYANMDHSNYDCFVCCVLSHGDDGFIYCSDYCKMEIKELISYFSPKYCPSLGGKPKLFFLSCCQGKVRSEGIRHVRTEEQTTLESDGPYPDTSELLPENADLLIGYATMPGYASFRETTKGTFYIQELTQALLEHHKKKHLLDLLLLVNNKLSQKNLKVNDKIYKQVAAPQMTLRKPVWL